MRAGERGASVKERWSRNAGVVAAKDCHPVVGFVFSTAMTLRNFLPLLPLVGVLALGGSTAQADTDVLDKKFTPAEIQQIQTKADLTQRYYNELVRRAKEDGRTMDRRTLNMLKAQAEDAAARGVQQQPQAPQAKSTLPDTQPSEIRRSSNYKNFESVKK